MYPSEVSGGSWVGVNERGFCLALINWYAITPAVGSGRVSRGIIIPQLLKTDDSDKARGSLGALPLHDMKPFRLIAFDPRTRQVREFSWGNQVLNEIGHPWEPGHWFSSGHDEAEAQRTRRNAATVAWRERRAGSLPWMRRLHASHAPNRGPFCFCMHRSGAATVSYTEVVVTRREARMRYHDGSLCDVPEPSAACTLARCL